MKKANRLVYGYPMNMKISTKKYCIESLSLGTHYNILFNKIKRIKDIPQGREKIEKLTEYLQLLMEYNKKTNLVGSNDPFVLIDKHIIDCIIAFPYFIHTLNDIKDYSTKKIADIGSGAGFPGILLSIFLQNPIYLIESKSRKTEFLQEVKEKLELPHIVIVQKNVREYKNKFSIITSRAFANFSTLHRYTKHLLTKNTHYLLYKGKSQICHEEMKNCQKNYNVLKLKNPYLKDERHLLIVN